MEILTKIREFEYGVWQDLWKFIFIRICLKGFSWNPGSCYDSNDVKTVKCGIINVV